MLESNFIPSHPTIELEFETENSLSAIKKKLAHRAIDFGVGVHMTQAKDTQTLSKLLYQDQFRVFRSNHVPAKKKLPTVYFSQSLTGTKLDLQGLMLSMDASFESAFQVTSHESAANLALAGIAEAILPSLAVSHFVSTKQLIPSKHPVNKLQKPVGEHSICGYLLESR